MNHHLLNCSPDCNHTPPTHKVRVLAIALILILLSAVAELAAGLICHSLALVAESGHLLADGLALSLSLVAVWVAQLPASPQATFGYRRIEILAALLNGLGLLGVASWIGWEALIRLRMPEPAEILSLPMLVTAIVGVVVNSINAKLLHQDSHHDLNLRGAFLHLVADAVSAVGVMIAAIAIGLLGWTWADGAISLVVALLIAVSTIPLIRQSLDILLEKTPNHLDVEQIATHLKSFSGVLAVQNLRVWTIALGQEAISAHLTVIWTQGSKRDRLLQQMQESLQQEFGISEVFLQLSSGLPLDWIDAVPDRLVEQIDRLNAPIASTSIGATESESGHHPNYARDTMRRSNGRVAKVD